MIEPTKLQDLVARWWWNYDEGNFEVLTSLLTDDGRVRRETDALRLAKLEAILDTIESKPFNER